MADVLHSSDIEESERQMEKENIRNNILRSVGHLVVVLPDDLYSMCSVYVFILFSEKPRVPTSQEKLQNLQKLGNFVLPGKVKKK